MVFVHKSLKDHSTQHRRLCSTGTVRRCRVEWSSTCSCSGRKSYRYNPMCRTTPCVGIFSNLSLYVPGTHDSSTTVASQAQQDRFFPHGTTSSSSSNSGTDDQSSARLVSQRAPKSMAFVTAPADEDLGEGSTAGGEGEGFFRIGTSGTEMVQGRPQDEPRSVSDDFEVSIGFSSRCCVYNPSTIRSVGFSSYQNSVVCIYLFHLSNRQMDLKYLPPKRHSRCATTASCKAAACFSR